MSTYNKKIYLFLMLIFTPFMVNATSSSLSEEYQTNIQRAKVIEIIKETTYSESIVQSINIEILSGDYDGEIAQINNTYLGNGYDFYLEEGDYISVVVEEGEEVSYYFYSIDKTNSIILLLLIFASSIIILGGMKGFKALISLGITVALIILVLIPLLLEGYSPIFLSVLICMLSTITTFVITNGFSKKSLVAIIGVCGGLIVAGTLAYLFGVLANITGYSSGDAQMLQYLPSGVSFNYKGLLFAGIIIGALGACMDVAMEITSSLIEIKKHKPKISNKELVKSGFNIGQDIMGTMVNTLVLAYTGGSLSSILIFIGFEKSLYQIINLESIATEIIRALAGSMGLLFAIPCTIYVFVFLNKKWGDITDEKKKIK